jgi:hypothetical protein
MPMQLHVSERAEQSGIGVPDMLTKEGAKPANKQEYNSEKRRKQQLGIHQVDNKTHTSIKLRLRLYNCHETCMTKQDEGKPRHPRS